jgi:hypothetical protein
MKFTSLAKIENKQKHHDKKCSILNYFNMTHFYSKLSKYTALRLYSLTIQCYSLHKSYTRDDGPVWRKHVNLHVVIV